MSAHLSNEIVERFHSQALASGDRGVIYNHILGCETCRRRVVTSQTEAVAIQTLTDHLLAQEGEEPFHLDPATIEAFVDDNVTMIDRNIVNLHLADCVECSDEVTDLRESLATMKAASHSPEERPQTSETLTRRALKLSMPMRIAAVVALIAFATVALLVASRWRSTGPDRPTDDRDITAGTQPTPLASPQTPSVTPSPDVVNPPQLAENPPGKISDERDRNVIAALKDGANEIALDSGGNIVGFPSLPPTSRQAVKEALTGEPLARPDVLDEVASAQVSVRSSTGDEAPISITYPLSRVISESKPTLRWKPSKTAEGYRVEIADEKFHQVAKNDDLPSSSQSWKPLTALKRGGIYTWTIRAINKEGPSSLTSQAKFKVLSEESIRELNRLKASRSHLALGMFYAREGMITEAEREFGILLKQNPNSTIAKKLLTDVRSWRRR